MLYIAYQWPPIDPTKMLIIQRLILPFLQDPTLYSIKAILVMDNDGARIVSKVRGGLCLVFYLCFSCLGRINTDCAPLRMFLCSLTCVESKK